MQPNNIRIKDIAEMAGVSEGTVDRVIHKRGNVSKSAAEKVNKVLAKIKYKPNLIARTLGKGKQYKIATLIPDPLSDPFWKQSYEGILAATEQLHQFGLNITIENFFYDLDREESFIEEAAKNFYSGPDAVLIAPLFYHASISFFKNLKQKKIPFVLFNTKIPDVEPLSFIGQDLFGSGRLAGLLTSIGQREIENIIVLHIDEDLQNAIHLKEKESGFRDFQNSNSVQHRVISFTISSVNGTQLKSKLESIIQEFDPYGIFISTSKSFKVASIIKGINPNIKIIGYDLIAANIEGLKSGKIDFIINQNPSRQAKLGIQILANNLLFNRKFRSEYLLPLEVICIENMSSYLLHSEYTSAISV